MPQHHKGDRDFIGVRIPRRVADELRRDARARHLNVTEYVSVVLAEHLGMPDETGPLPPRSSEEELPLTG